MGTRIRSALLLFALVMVALLLSTGVASAGKPAKPPKPAPFVYQPGDILFMTDPTDPWYSVTYWTHNAIYVGKVNGVDMVAEAVSTGLRYWPLKDWCLNHDRMVMRLNATYVDPRRSEITAAAVAYARSRVEAGTRYDWSFSKETEDRQYCSELIWRAYLRGGLDLDSDDDDITTISPGELVTPSDEAGSPHLVKVAEFSASRR